MNSLLREFVYAVLQEGKHDLEVVNMRSMSSVVNSTINSAIETLKGELSQDGNAEASDLARSLGRFRFFYVTEFDDVATGATLHLSVGAHVSYGHNGSKLFNPDVTVQVIGGSASKFAKFEHETEVRVKEMVLPCPVTNGLWWADDNLYLLRPLLLGESPTLPPKKGWSAIDELTYEPWNSKAKRR